MVCRNVLLKARELKVRTLGLCVVNSVRRNYPPDEGAHIALSMYYLTNVLSKVIH